MGAWRSRRWLGISLSVAVGVMLGGTAHACGGGGGTSGGTQEAGGTDGPVEGYTANPCLQRGGRCTAPGGCGPGERCEGPSPAECMTEAPLCCCVPAGVDAADDTEDSTVESGGDASDDAGDAASKG